MAAHESDPSTMKIASRVGWWFVVMAALAASCKRNDDAGQSQSSPAPSAASPVSAPSAMDSSVAAAATARAFDAIPGHGHGRARRDGGDPTSALLHAASELALSQAQKTTLESLDALRERGAAENRTAMDKLQQDLVTGIKAGKLDAAAIKKDEAAIDHVAQARAASDADALNALHSALDTVERRALIDAMRARQALWSSGPNGSPDGGRRDGWGADFRKKRFEPLTSQLDLDSTQQGRVAAVSEKVGGSAASFSAERDERRERLDRVLSAFGEDLFDAKTVMAPAQMQPSIESAHQQVAFVSQVLSILRPDQRETFARNVEPSTARPPRPEDDGAETR
jgi:hypothetical protein